MRRALACHRPQNQPIPSRGLALEPNLGSRRCRGRGGVRSIKLVLLQVSQPTPDGSPFRSWSAGQC